MTKDLAYYQEKLRALRVDRSSGHAKPHKVCLLLAVMEMIDEREITENRILFDEHLKTRFSVWFEKFKSGNDIDEPSQPFFYLESSGFWHHQPKAGYEEEYLKRISDRNHGGPGAISRLIDYAYLDGELFEFMQRPAAHAVIFNALMANLDDMGRRFQHWASSVGKSDKTIRNYLGAIDSSISKWVRDEGLLDHGLLEITSYENFARLAEQTRKLEIFTKRDRKGNGMYSAALKLYGEFLSDITQHDAGQDIQEINRDSKLDVTEKETLINSRIGQGQFRQRLIDYWGHCAVTAYHDTRMLVASHIKPWRSADNRERLDVYNGVLLLPNLDKAFDRGFISFTEYGQILISDELEEHKAIGVEENMKIPMKGRHQDYMRHHREFVSSIKREFD